MVLFTLLLIIIMIAILHHPATARDASACIYAIKTVIFSTLHVFSSLLFAAAALCVSMWCELFWACCGSSLRCDVCCVSFRALWKKTGCDAFQCSSEPLFPLSAAVLGKNTIYIFILMMTSLSLTVEALTAVSDARWELFFKKFKYYFISWFGLF